MENDGVLPPNFRKASSAEEAAQDPQVKALIEPRLKRLMDIANSFLQTIINSLDQVPYGIRWICKQIRSLTKRKYPDASEYAICSLIGGFFFLRFINPAIVTPQAYMLVDGIPSNHPRTTLTMASRMHSMMSLFSHCLSLLDCQNATKLGQQADLCKRGVHDPNQSICRSQQATYQQILE